MGGKKLLLKTFDVLVIHTHIISGASSYLITHCNEEKTGFPKKNRNVANSPHRLHILSSSTRSLRNFSVTLNVYHYVREEANEKKYTKNINFATNFYLRIRAHEIKIRF